LLLENNANPNLATTAGSGLTPLHLVAQEGTVPLGYISVTDV
uniref:88 kDa ankyrin-related protein (Fragments) n=1 Tax=Plasmodium falciparum TaxID=5833 RepID=Q9TXG8_PLAFA